jgi:short-subunit dehydrogenase
VEVNVTDRNCWCRVGLGLELAKELSYQGALVIATTREDEDVPNIETIGDIDVQDDKCGDKIVRGLKGRKVDILINNAGYFTEKEERLDALDFSEEKKMIDVCAIGPLRVTSALFKAGLLAKHAKVIMITSQAGSISWRLTQNPEGHDYGHHMSKAASTMDSVLLSQELKQAGIAVGIFHPGFNKTEMTTKYKHKWEEEGAVDPAVGAKRVCHEICRLDMKTTGRFINCEDGLEIPF